jgi:hypothetical protein
LLEVGKATKILTRQEYFLTVTDSMMDARVEVIGFITGRLPTGDDKKRVRDIINNIEKLTKNDIKVKYLVPKFPDRLHIGYLYSRAGAEVRYGIGAIASDIRYIIVDDRFVVMKKKLLKKAIEFHPKVLLRSLKISSTDAGRKV